MARIPASSPEKIVSIKQFKGLNENSDGDTKISLGEATTCLNWKVTKDGNLKRRPGHELVCILGDATEAVSGLWHGWVGGYEYLLAACKNKVYVIYNGYTATFPEPATEIGTIVTGHGAVHMFGFDDKVYILDGTDYYEWNGATFSSVVGYVPLVANAIGPVGTAEAGGTLLEQVNKLTAKRRVWISPDGTNKKFQFPEKNLSSIDAVVDLGTNTTVATTDYTANTTDGTVEFNSVPALGTNSYEIQYTASTSYRSQVVAMRYSELFSGSTDNCVFLYGDGSNEVFYSDIDYDGKGRADYFPDMNEIAIGDENTPVTGLIRHFSRLICFKSDSTWAISSSTITLADGTLIPSFYITPVNRSIGNEALGQVSLVLNNPRTLFRGSLYEWRGSKSYGNLTNDERQAARISDRIKNSLSEIWFPGAVCYDDNANQEYYICYNGYALIHNYAVDAWYMYDNMYATCFANFDDVLYMGGNGGQVRRFNPAIRNDVGDDDDENAKYPIVSVWISGAMDFGADYMRKYSSSIWISVKPESGSYTHVMIETDRRIDFAERIMSRGVSRFADWDFRTFTFSNDTQPQIKKLRFKAKKFVYYRLIFSTIEEDMTATILGVDIKTRQTGYAK